MGQATLFPHAWGKLRRRCSDAWPDAVLALADHAADVAAVTAALLDLPSVRARLCALAGAEITDDQRAAMTGAAFLHDIGKANRGFWGKQRPPAEREGSPIAGHVREAAPLLFRPFGGRPIAIPDAGAFLKPATPAGTLLLAALGHHGEPVSCASLSDEASRHAALWQPAEGYDPVAEARALCHALAAWLPDSLRAAEQLPPLPFPLLHGFAGLLSLADWIASNPAPGFFPFEGDGTDDRWAFARTRAREVLRAMRLDPGPARSALVRAAPDFGAVFRERHGPLTPKPLQVAMAGLDLGPIVVAEAATGAGKTEAALWRFRSLMAVGAVDGLAFLLPTRTAAVQIEARVRRAVEAMWPDPATRPNTVLAVPGYLRADGEEGARLPGFEVLWPDSEDQEAAHRRWAAESPKRSLAGTVVVGTVDQALLAALKVRHAHLRGACLLRALLVVDEVHASDAYMSGLLRTLLARHQAAGGHALLLSATLGVAARQRLLMPAPSAKPAIPPLAEAEAAPYPAISDRSGLRGIKDEGRERRVAPRLEAWLDAPEAVAATALAAARHGARVLVVRNTVAGVLAAQRALEAAAAPDDAVLFRANGVVAPHHGRFAAPDRRVLDAAVEARFGKWAGREGGCVLVGSQTLEQSLDIDADLLLTDLCPMDVLLQRLGRLHRHERARPAGFEDAVAIVLVPAERDLSPFLPGRSRGLPRHGLGGTVYPNLLTVEATWRLLEERSLLRLPGDNRLLVEHATHPEALTGIAEALGPAWQKLRQDLLGIESAQFQQAGSIALRWEEDLLDMTFPRRLDERIGTRLGTDDRRLRLEPPSASPFGSMLEEVVVPGWMAGELGKGVEVAQAEEAADGLLLRAGESCFHYGRLGLQRVEGG
ncbi:CRISPR-associated helicase Cas3' [Crenalkalicoccus roseus]|uniref:CRISPR-associated helicase Cas3' n=1 Tax=Crenalkalicoccus roseus TaxID=1485588 RepID=UPI00108017D8|nr:CRISPR-associated helicase Cas3' [Crenalkalicoccus roseus]